MNIKFSYGMMMSKLFKLLENVHCKKLLLCLNDHYFKFYYQVSLFLQIEVILIMDESPCLKSILNVFYIE